MKYIYMITAINSRTYTAEKYDPKNPRPRAWEWRSSLKKAMASVENNWEFFEDCYYDYIVIEKLQQGFCTAKDVAWYKINHTDHIDNSNMFLEPCDKPEWAKPIVNWSLG